MVSLWDWRRVSRPSIYSKHPICIWPTCSNTVYLELLTYSLRRGYIAIQSTRPATINFLISSSPIGLMAWIWDKLVDWSDEYPWTEDEVCLWTSMYVFSRAGPEAASYIYYEALHDGAEITIPVVQGYIDVPLGISDFPVEICNNPKAWRPAMVSLVWGSPTFGANKEVCRDRSCMRRRLRREAILQAGRDRRILQRGFVRCSAREEERMALWMNEMDIDAAGGTGDSKLF